MEEPKESEFEQFYANIIQKDQVRQLTINSKVAEVLGLRHRDRVKVWLKKIQIPDTNKQDNPSQQTW